MAHGDIHKALALEKGINLHKHRTYRIWKSMRQRCYRANHHAREKYGGRGITVCERWNDFLLFLEDMGHPPTEYHSIDRKDNNGNYEKSNCKWSTPKEQNANKSNAALIPTPNGIMSITEAAIYYGLRVDTLWRRINVYMWPESQWFNTTDRKK